LTLIFRMGLGACLSCFWLLRRPTDEKRTIIYQSQYFATNSMISECDYTKEKSKTWTGERKQQVKPNLLKATRWWVAVRVWPTTMHHVGCLDRFRTKPNHCSSPKPDHWRVTRTSCYHYHDIRMCQNNARTLRSCSLFTDSYKALFQYTNWNTTELGANWSQS